MLKCHWLCMFRCVGALARSTDRSNALLHAACAGQDDRVSHRSRNARAKRGSLLCVAPRAGGLFCLACHRSTGSLLSAALASAHVLLKMLNGPYLMLGSVIKNGRLTAPLGPRPLYRVATRVPMGTLHCLCRHDHGSRSTVRYSSYLLAACTWEKLVATLPGLEPSFVNLVNCH